MSRCAGKSVSRFFNLIQFLRHRIAALMCIALRFWAISKFIVKQAVGWRGHARINVWLDVPTCFRRLVVALATDINFVQAYDLTPMMSFIVSCRRESLEWWEENHVAWCRYCRLVWRLASTLKHSPFYCRATLASRRLVAVTWPCQCSLAASG